MIDRVKVAVDNRNWGHLEHFCLLDPSRFFGSLTVRYLGKLRMEWLKDIALNRYDSSGQKDYFANLVLNCCNVAFGKKGLG